jgi:hypothetical protein
MSSCLFLPSVILLTIHPFVFLFLAEYFRNIVRAWNLRPGLTSN